MRIDSRDSVVDDREAMIRLIDIVGREHIFAPYHIETPLPAAPGLLALVRPTGHRFAGIHSIVHPPWWDVLYIEQAQNVCRRAGRMLRNLQARNLGPTKVMVRWLPDSAEDRRLEIERALIAAHDPELNKKSPAGDLLDPSLAAACG